MKIVAKRGDSGYLFQTSSDQGRVLDTESGTLYPEMGINSILSRGYWEAYSSSKEEQKLLLSLVTLKLN